MLPCERIAVSLVDFCDRPGHLSLGGPYDEHHPCHSQLQQAGSQPLQAHEKQAGAGHVAENIARVFYLNHAAEHSFIEAHFLAQLWAKKHGDAVPMPTLSKDTRVRLRWRFSGLHGMSFTSIHSVLREITFDVILQENDWYGPIMTLWDWEKRQSMGHHHTAYGERGVAQDENVTGHNPPLDNDEMLREASVASDSENENNSSYANSLRSSSVAPSSPSACPSDDDHSSGEIHHTLRRHPQRTVVSTSC
jgi:hypothetical protein